MITALVAMAAIILIQMVLSFAFTYQVGKVFSEVSICILFFHYLGKSRAAKRKARG